MDDDMVHTVELQPIEQSWQLRSRACEIKNHDDDAIDWLFRAANRYSIGAAACIYLRTLFPRERYKIHNSEENYLVEGSSRIRASLESLKSRRIIVDRGRAEDSKAGTYREKCRRVSIGSISRVYARVTSNYPRDTGGKNIRSISAARLWDKQSRRLEIPTNFHAGHMAPCCRALGTQPSRTHACVSLSVWYMGLKAVKLDRPMREAGTRCTSWCLITHSLMFFRNRLHVLFSFYGDFRKKSCKEFVKFWWHFPRARELKKLETPVSVVFKFPAKCLDVLREFWNIYLRLFYVLKLSVIYK